MFVLGELGVTSVRLKYGLSFPMGNIMLDSAIKIIGRWSSNCYQRNIHLSDKVLMQWCCGTFVLYKLCFKGFEIVLLRIVLRVVQETLLSKQFYTELHFFRGYVLK